MATLSAPTLQRLITNVRVLLNSRDPNNSFWTNDELTEYLDEAVRIYFLEAVTANEGYFTTQTDLDIVANTETVALPTDCFQVKNLWKKITDGYASLGYHNDMTHGYSTQGGTSSDGFIPDYHFQGNNIVLRPTPNFSQTAGLRIEYIQLPDQMIWGGDSLTAQVSPIFKQILEVYAVYKAKFKESLVNGGMSYQVPKDHLADLYSVFKQTIARRSKNPTYIEAYSPETES